MPIKKFQSTCNSFGDCLWCLSKWRPFYDLCSCWHPTQGYSRSNRKRIHVFDLKHFHILVKIVVTHYFVSASHPLHSGHSKTQPPMLVGKIHQKVWCLTWRRLWLMKLCYSKRIISCWNDLKVIFCSKLECIFTT